MYKIKVILKLIILKRPHANHNGKVVLVKLVETDILKIMK